MGVEVKSGAPNFSSARKSSRTLRRIRDCGKTIWARPFVGGTTGAGCVCVAENVADGGGAHEEREEKRCVLFESDCFFFGGARSQSRVSLRSVVGLLLSHESWARRDSPPRVWLAGPFFYSLCLLELRVCGFSNSSATRRDNEQLVWVFVLFAGKSGASHTGGARGVG